MKNTTPILIGAILLFVIVAAAGVYAYTASRPDKDNPLQPVGITPSTPGSATLPPSIKSFDIQRPNFIARGENLGRVEVWATIGGQPRLLGTMVRQSSAPTAGMGDAWTMPIPARIGATAIYARGYDKTGSPVARFDLPAAQVRGL